MGYSINDAASLLKESPQKTLQQANFQQGNVTEPVLANDPNLCPQVSNKQFPLEDVVRYCVPPSGRGGTCSVFKEKPFKDCPLFREPFKEPLHQR